MGLRMCFFASSKKSDDDHLDHRTLSTPFTRDDDKTSSEEREKAKTFEEGVSRTGSIGIWREYDDDNDDGARDRVRRVSRQLLSQGMYNIRFSFCLLSLSL